MRTKNKGFSKLWSIGNFLLFVTIGISVTSCDLFKFKSQEELDESDPIVATVANQHLRKSELSFVKTESSTAEDSMEMANRYVQSWIKKQLMIREAGKSMEFDEAEINRKLLDYKYALMVYEYEKAYVNSKIDQEISLQEIAEYYAANQKNFTLREIIVRTNFLKMEKGNSQNRELEKLLSGNKSAEDVKKIALKDAVNYFLEDSTWVRFEDIIINTPLVSNNNKVQLLKQNSLIKVDDEDYRYYFKILEYKLQDQIPPLDFVKDEISKILINKKRVSLIDALQKEIYNRALENNEIRLYD
ncbi:hypothetical protein P872_06965 [Rhodonellum psychrophilum GCM71 = DSM 17998]|uniref:Uncharacterized protein n=2 Tax=Rhodonellum TaxID=336827 RepID=U5BZ00_9BACT|nr:MULTISPECIES: peptidylprolyl isomerase [Rhodonellum]ERM81871.1 hypothetical protein P872_06965 [Rhodonellum psychrophilum GCM71 = DSM 17998]SDY67514.1 PPIC-type PPIASE domain-containing protein [Rhodonellum ikkaensis]